MSPSPVHHPASPHITPPPELPPSSRRAPKRRLLPLAVRQSIPDQAAIANAEAQCEDADQSTISCYPLSNTTIAQHQVIEFVWNSRLPWYAQTNLVNISLFDADTGLPIRTWPDVENPTNRAGTLPVTVDDTFWGSQGAKFSGTNTSYPFYFEVQSNHPPADNLDPSPQAQFLAIQTTFPDSIIASMSSASAASASSASAASVSSALAASSSSEAASASSSAAASSRSSSSTPSASGGNIQSAASSGSFPHWAIAVIVVLGFLFIVAACLLFFLILRRVRRRGDGSLQYRGSIGSNAPMMAHAQEAATVQSPLLGGVALGAAGGALAESGSHRHPPSVVSPDGASTISRANSGSEGGLISGADAAIMADAFRKALRKPEFLGERPVEEGDTPESAGPDSAGFDNGHRLLNQELAEEGTGLRTVGSSRDVHVEHSVE